MHFEILSIRSFNLQGKVKVMIIYSASNLVCYHQQDQVSGQISARTIPDPLRLTSWFADTTNMTCESER